MHFGYQGIIPLLSLHVILVKLLIAEQIFYRYTYNNCVKYLLSLMR